MKIRDQICSLELAKKLKDLGVKQESYFYFYNYQKNGWRIEPTGWLIESIKSDNPIKPFILTVDEDIISAFTVAELGEILPDNFITFKNNNSWLTGWNGKEWKLLGKVNNKSDKEADARAKMIIYLLENGMIKNECK